MMIKDISMINATYHTNNTYHIIIYYESISQYTEFLLSFSLFPFRNCFPFEIHVSCSSRVSYRQVQNTLESMKCHGTVLLPRSALGG